MTCGFLVFWSWHCFSVPLHLNTMCRLKSGWGVCWGGVSTIIWTKRVHWPLTINLPNKSTQLIKIIWLLGGCPLKFLYIYSFDISGICCWHGKNAPCFINRDTDYFQISNFFHNFIKCTLHIQSNASWLKVVGRVNPHLKMNIKCDSPGTYDAPTMQVGERECAQMAVSSKAQTPAGAVRCGSLCWGWTSQLMAGLVHYLLLLHTARAVIQHFEQIKLCF